MFLHVALGVCIGAAVVYAVFLWVLWLEYRDTCGRCPCPFCPVDHEGPCQGF